MLTIHAPSVAKDIVRRPPRPALPGSVGGLARAAAREAAQEIASGHRVALHGQSRTRSGLTTQDDLARMMRANPHIGTV